MSLFCGNRERFKIHALLGEHRCVAAAHPVALVRLSAFLLSADEIYLFVKAEIVRKPLFLNFWGPKNTCANIIIAAVCTYAPFCLRMLFLFSLMMHR